MKKIMCLILVLLLFANMPVCAAKYSDVTEENQYFEAVELLNEANIMIGYDGKFRPEDIITRAEVVAIANRLLGVTEEDKKAAYAETFSDVSITDWYAGDVCYAAKEGIVAGDGDGTFRPNDEVQYNEAIKIMVTALGYSYEDALSKGGWPKGYIAIAAQEGIIKDAEVQGCIANRGTVAQMACEVYKILNKERNEKENVQSVECDEIMGLTANGSSLKINGAKTDTVKYDNDSYVMEHEVVLNYFKSDKDRTAVVKFVVANSHDRIEKKEIITIPKDTEEYFLTYKYDFKKTTWSSMLYKDLIQKKDTEVWFLVFVNDEKVDEFKKTFSYQYSAEKSVADSFEIYNVQMSTLSNEGNVVLKGNNIVKSANADLIKIDAKVRVDEASSDEGNIDIFHVDVEIYEDFQYNKILQKQKEGRLVSSFVLPHCPDYGDDFGFTDKAKFRPGRYTIVFSLYDKVLYTHDFTVKNP